VVPHAARAHVAELGDLIDIEQQRGERLGHFLFSESVDFN
jgi:hypothetical protein